MDKSRGRFLPLHGVLMKKVLATALVLMLSACFQIFDDECAIEKLAEVTSADSIFIATLARKNCGATSNYSYVVFLGETNKEKRKNFGDEIYVENMDENIKLNWEGGILKIQSQAGSDNVFKRIKKWKGVNIMYIN